MSFHVIGMMLMTKLWHWFQAEITCRSFQPPSTTKEPVVSLESLGMKELRDERKKLFAISNKCIAISNKKLFGPL